MQHCRSAVYPASYVRNWSAHKVRSPASCRTASAITPAKHFSFSPPLSSALSPVITFVVTLNVLEAPIRPQPVSRAGHHLVLHPARAWPLLHRRITVFFSIVAAAATRPELWQTASEAKARWLRSSSSPSSSPSPTSLPLVHHCD